MNSEPKTPPSQALALERFALVSVTLPQGAQRLFTRRTIEDWWYDYQHGGFAALAPKVRTDKGRRAL